MPSPRDLRPPAPATASRVPQDMGGFEKTAPVASASSYTETDTFKSISNWVRRSSAEMDEKSKARLAEEVDRTVPTPNAGTSADQLCSGTLPRYGAATATRRAPEPDSREPASEPREARQPATERRDISPIMRSWGAVPTIDVGRDPGRLESPRTATSAAVAAEVEATQTRTRSWAVPKIAIPSGEPSLPSRQPPPAAAKVPSTTTGDISPIICGRELRADVGRSPFETARRDSRGYMDEAMLDDTVPFNAAPDPRHLLSGALVSGGFLGALAAGREPATGF